jgi:hypothetical protein
MCELLHTSAVAQKMQGGVAKLVEVRIIHIPFSICSARSNADWPLARRIGCIGGVIPFAATPSAVIVVGALGGVVLFVVLAALTAFTGVCAGIELDIDALLQCEIQWSPGRPPTLMPVGQVLPPSVQIVLLAGPADCASAGSDTPSDKGASTEAARSQYFRRFAAETDRMACPLSRVPVSAWRS